eukprot:Amastigsp_a177042_14.p3 type:complete len:105 gc:universal Amastigsp_a177042_14:311-625(+)
MVALPRRPSQRSFCRHISAQSLASRPPESRKFKPHSLQRTPSSPAKLCDTRAPLPPSRCSRTAPGLPSATSLGWATRRVCSRAEGSPQCSQTRTTVTVPTSASA